MTQAEHFVLTFLQVEEKDFPFHINLLLFSETLDAYHEHMKAKEDIIHQPQVFNEHKPITTNDAQTKYTNLYNGMKP